MKIPHRDEHWRFPQHRVDNLLGHLLTNLWNVVYNSRLVVVLRKHSFPVGIWLKIWLSKPQAQPCLYQQVSPLGSSQTYQRAYGHCISLAMYSSFLHHHCLQSSLKEASHELLSIAISSLINYTLAYTVWTQNQLSLLTHPCALQEANLSPPPVFSTPKGHSPKREFLIDPKPLWCRGGLPLPSPQHRMEAAAPGRSQLHRGAPSPEPRPHTAPYLRPLRFSALLRSAPPRGSPVTSTTLRPPRRERAGARVAGVEAKAAAGMRGSVCVRECRALAAFCAVTSPPPPSCGPPPRSARSPLFLRASQGAPPRPARSTAPAAAASGTVPGTELGTGLQPPPDDRKRALSREPKGLPRMAAVTYGCSSLSLLVAVAAHVFVVIATLPWASESIIPDVGSGASCVRRELCRQSGTPALT